jgi:hypothetical protein
MNKSGFVHTLPSGRLISNDLPPSRRRANSRFGVVEANSELGNLNPATEGVRFSAS